MSSALTTQDTHSPSLAQSAMNSLASRHTERLERKYRQAQDEYKLTIEKYNMVRNDYEKRFSDGKYSSIEIKSRFRVFFFKASSKFQAFEIDHIEKMLAFSLSYSEILQRNSDQIRTAQNEFNNKLKLLTGNELLDLFIEQKKTGTDRPGRKVLISIPSSKLLFFDKVVLQFEEIDNLKSSISLSSELPMTQEDPNLSNQQDFNVPSFQAHFSVSSPGTKQTDISRGKSNENHFCIREIHRTIQFVIIIIIIIIIFFMVCMTSITINNGSGEEKEKPYVNRKQLCVF
jgi:hypothetical protein